MYRPHWLRLAALIVLATLMNWNPTAIRAETGESTRVTDPLQHARSIPGSRSYRSKCDYILKELDLKPGDVIADVGAGDGWWAERMVPQLGENGTIHALEVDQKLVDKMKEKFAEVPQVKPYVGPTDGTGLPENSCDVAFFSKVYHHLDEDGHVDYWRHLKTVVKPTGRVVIVEKYPQVGRGHTHGWPLSQLIKEAEEGGWVPLRCEVMTGTFHYVAIFVQKELFSEDLVKQEEKAENEEASQ